MGRTEKLLLALGGAGLAVYAARRSVLRASEPAALAVDATVDQDLDFVPPSPPQTAPPSSARPGRAAVSRRFDPLFAKHGNGIPVAYLRALAKRESNLNPREQVNPAWGLLQVIEVVRSDFNKRHGTRYARTDLLDPRINITIATDLLRRIIRSYANNHPGVPNLQQDWTNLRFVELLTFGWNAGYSERGGVGRVSRYLEGRGQHAGITIDTIHAAARSAGASRHLSNAKKVAWCKGVARLYATERARDINKPTLEA